jgi:Na+-transporting methylmalonyl-CoA/oxaloacetate decarboxylase gamma subunit
MDWEQLGEAGTLIGVGMAVVFAALLILMVAIMIVNRLAPERARKAQGSTVLEGIAAEESEREKVAVVAVALSRAMERETECAPQQGAISPAGSAGEPSRWAQAGREQVMRSRGKAGRQWGRRSD